MATSIPLVYPESLPGPTSAPFAPAERRLLSTLPGPRESRALQRDRLASQEVTFIYTHAELAIFNEWLETTLVNAGAWFAASWPQPQGGVGVRRFLGSPSFPTFYPSVGWMVTASVQGRGVGELPRLTTTNCGDAAAALDVAVGEMPLVFTYFSDDPVPNPPEGIVGSYVSVGRDPGALGPDSSFPTSFTIAWDDLEDPSTVNLLSTTRVGTGSSTVSLLLTVTDLPPSGTHCKSVLYMTDGSWTNGGTVANGAVSVNGEDLGYSTYIENLPGTGFLVGSIVLRADHGVLSAGLY